MCCLLIGLAAVCSAADADLDPKRLAEIQALGKKDDAASRAALLALIVDPKADYNERDLALRTIVLTHEGGMALLKLLDDEKFPDELKAPGSYAFAASPDAEVKALADKKLPVPKTKDKEPVPPIAKLAEMKGDSAAGALVFRDPKGPNCVNCHMLGKDGKFVGPPLDTIGDKLSKAQFYEAILTPSAAIEMSYEAWTVKTKKGEIKTGILVENSDDRVALRDTNGDFLEFAPADVAMKKKQTLSLMPEGLTTTMTLKDLVNLVEFLSEQKPK